MSMDHDYARRKLKTLLRDVNNYTADEFWRQMSRIAAGATGQAHAEDLKTERDALAAHVELLELSGNGLHHELEQWSLTEGDPESLAAMKAWCAAQGAEPTTSLARRDSRMAAEAMREIAEWMDPDSEKVSGPTYHEAEMIGMEISGPTFCSDARRCMKAGNRAFLEAARIWEYKSRQAEAGAA